MSTESMLQFREVFLNSTELQERLKAAPDAESFVRLAVELGQECGYTFTVEEVEATILDKARRPVIDPPTLDNAIETFKSSSRLEQEIQRLLLW